jgi:ABC-type branched-subunit amino acid transport system substrate-binding protein
VNKRTAIWTIVGLVVAMVTVAGATARTTSQAQTPGVTKTHVVIGATFPFSGVASAYGVIAKAEAGFYKWVNAHGGVNGRKIVFITKDDGYNPAQTVPLTKQLVEQNHVFAIVGQLGTEPVLSVRGYLNQHKVPQVLVSTGASYWGTQYKKYPWTIGWQPNYVAEGALYGQYIRAKQKSAKIAILYQNDDYGSDYVRGLTKGLGGTSKIVAKQGYSVTESSVASEMARLKASGANTLFVAATPSFAVQSVVIAYKLNWHPRIYMNNVSATNDLMNAAANSSSPDAVNGIISTAYTQIPDDPVYANTPGMKLYRKIMAAEKVGTRLSDAFNVYGMGQGWMFVDALKRAGKNPTRASLMRALLHTNTKANPFLLPGMVTKTSPTDHFPLEQARLDRFTNSHFVPFGALLTYKRY